MHGSKLTYDGESNASYLTVDPAPDATVARTVQVDLEEIMVDVDVDGRILGVEVLHEMGVPDLLLVLRRCRLVC